MSNISDDEPGSTLRWTLFFACAAFPKRKHCLRLKTSEMKFIHGTERLHKNDTWELSISLCQIHSQPAYASQVISSSVNVYFDEDRSLHLDRRFHNYAYRTRPRTKKYCMPSSTSIYHWISLFADLGLIEVRFDWHSPAFCFGSIVNIWRIWKLV